MTQPDPVLTPGDGLAVDGAVPDVVGLDDIARRLDVQPGTVRQWRWRKLLPEPRWTIGDQPAWLWSSIEAWAKQTGRLVETPPPVV